MIQSVSKIAEETGTDPGPEVTVRCRIASNPMPGETGGTKTVYLVEDPYDQLDTQAALSFWGEEPTHLDGLSRTSTFVRSTLSIPTPGELERGEYSPDSKTLQRGEEVLARVVPNRSSEEETLFLNVTSFVVREPDQLVSKGKLRTQDRCPREYYLRYVKRVYPGDKFQQPPYQLANQFRGDAIHKITENALLNHRDRFLDRTWNISEVESFCESQFAEEFGFRQALLVLSGAGLHVKEHVVDAVMRLFTDEEFLDRITAASNIRTERYLSREYGYAGRVDILLDGVPYDIKTTRDVDNNTVRKHSHQIKLYLFALLLEELDQDQSFEDAIDAGQTGYLVYPNASETDTVRFETVHLTRADVQEFLKLRNDVIGTADSFAPPSTYNRDCDGCAFAVEEWITGPDDSLAPACTYHCQNERRWPCYETDGGELTTDCSLFDQCNQRTKYRDPDVIDHFEGTRRGFQNERRARQTAGRILSEFNADILTAAGYLLPELECTGASAAGTILRFSTDEPVVPVFEPGEVVTIRQQNTTSGTKVIYYGEADGEYLFTPVDEQITVARFLSVETQYEAIYSFDVDAIEERYLPYLDFAQRRNNGEPIDKKSSIKSDSEIPTVVDPGEVSDYLDRERIFVDVPASNSRNEILIDLIEELITAAYTSPQGETVPESAQRSLILGTQPSHVELTMDAQPEGDHYRIDGTGGPNTIQNTDGYHSIQTRLLDSQSLVSTVQQATSKNGIGGMREFFHRLTEGDFGERDHSDSFFDVLIIMGAQRLTEPEYYFLADVADTIVAIGDRHRKGPEMLSATATEAGLDSFFSQQFERYRSFPSEEAIGLQIEGDAPPALQTFYTDGPWEQIDGTLQFLRIEGDEETALDSIEFETTIPSATDSARRLVFDVTDSPISPMKAHELFENRIELDATAFKEESIVVLDKESLYLRSKERLEGEDSNHHQVIVTTKPEEFSQFSRALLSNHIAEQIVVEVASEKEPDLIVTPFENHATKIKRLLDEKEIDIPVRRPENFDGQINDHAVISFATSNPGKIVRPPLNDPTVLYLLFASARNLTMIGSQSTLESKDVFKQLVDHAERYDSYSN